MNRKNLASALVVAVAALAGNAFAETPNAVQETPFASALTRAQVQAELVAYKQAGVNPWSTQYNPLRSFKSGASRADVTAAYIASRDNVAAFTGEDSGSAYLAQGRTQRVSDTLAAK